MGFYTTVAEFPEKSNSESCYAAVLEILEYVEQYKRTQSKFLKWSFTITLCFSPVESRQKKRAQNYKEYDPLVFGDGVFTVWRKKFNEL